MSSEARASYQALSITPLRTPEALTPDYWLQHEGRARRQPRRRTRLGNHGFLFSKEELHFAADAREIARQRIL